VNVSMTLRPYDWNRGPGVVEVGKTVTPLGLACLGRSTSMTIIAVVWAIAMRLLRLLLLFLRTGGGFPTAGTALLVGRDVDL
jgi:hypothetical protein